MVADAPTITAGVEPVFATVVGENAPTAGKKVKALTSRRKATTRTLSFILSVFRKVIVIPSPKTGF
jgi:hypothetical protein